MKDRLFTHIWTTIAGILFILFGCFLIVSRIMGTIGVWENEGANIKEIAIAFTVGAALIGSKDSYFSSILKLVLTFFKKK